MKCVYYAIISEINFYSKSPFTFMDNVTSPRFRQKRSLEKWLYQWDEDIDGILSYTIEYCKIKK